MKSKVLIVSCLAALACASSTFAGMPLPPTVPVFTGHGQPSDGSDEVQLITFASSATGGSFRLKYGNYATTAIAWNGVRDQLATNVERALNALIPIGVGGVAVTGNDDVDEDQVGLTVTFQGQKVTRLDVPELTIKSNDLLGPGHGMSIVTSIDGVTADGRSSRIGAVYIDSDSGDVYTNQGMPPYIQWGRANRPIALLGDVGGGVDVDSQTAPHIAFVFNDAGSAGSLHDAQGNAFTVAAHTWYVLLTSPDSLPHFTTLQSGAR